MKHYIVNRAFQLMDNTQKSPTDSEVHDLNETSYRMSHNSSTQVYYLGLNHNQLQLANGTISTSLVCSESLAIIQGYYQSCDNISLPIKITLFTECTIQNKIYWCHKCYKRQGPWYDFAMVRWAKDGSEDCNVITLPALRPNAPVELINFFKETTYQFLIV